MVVVCGIFLGGRSGCLGFCVFGGVFLYLAGGLLGVWGLCGVCNGF